MLYDIIKRYLRIFPEEQGDLQALVDQIERGDQLNDRKNFQGHITGGAIVLSPDMQKILIIRHKLFNKWLQPGGHWDKTDEGPWQAAQREAEEETRVVIDHLLPVFEDICIPIDIGPHPIKNRPQKKEPAHMHYDFRYIFVAAMEQLKLKTKEVNIQAADWASFDDPRVANLEVILGKMQRMGLIS